LAALPVLFGALTQAASPESVANTWRSVSGGMLTARSSACAVLLEDGRVLIAGGESSGSALSSAEILDASGRFRAAVSMATPHGNPACALLPDGTVMVAGGRAAGGFSNVAEIYDPQTNSWKAGPAMAQAGAGATVSVLTDGRVLLAGGETAGGVTDTLELFDPQSGSFRPVPARLSSPRVRHAAALLADGRVLIAGGWDGTKALDTADLFDPVSGAVTSAGHLAFARAGLSATTLLDGRVLAAGGTDGQNEQPAAEIFDPHAGQWIMEGRRMITPRTGHSAIVIPHNNGVLFVGGTTRGPDGDLPLAQAEIYFPWLREFHAAGSLEAAKTSVAALPSGRAGEILVAGGRSAAGSALKAEGNAEIFLAPTIFTDKPSDMPGEIAHVRGSGWAPGQAVRVSVTADSSGEEAALVAMADAWGNWTASWQALEGGGRTFPIYVTGTQNDTAAGGRAVALSARAGVGGSNVNPPVLSLAFGASSIPVNGSTSLQYTITNPSTNTGPLAGVGFTDSLPSGLVVATPNGLAGACGVGNIHATAGTGVVSLAGATLAANTSCTFSVQLTGTASGTKTTSVAASYGTSRVSKAVSASLTVVAAPPPATHFAISAPATATAGAAFSYTVTALDSSNHTVTTYSGTVHFSTSDGQGTLPANTKLTNGSGMFNATLKTAASESITAADTTTSITGAVAIAVKAGAPASIAASGGTPQSVVVGQPFAQPLQATVKDLYGNPVSASTVTYQAPSGGASALLPTRTVTTNQSGVAALSATANGVTGSYTVSVSISPGATAVFLLTNLAAAAPAPQPAAPAPQPQSLQLTSAGAGSYSVPKSGPYAGLGSFYIDMRISKWGGPSGACAPLVQFVTAPNWTPSAINLCDPAYGWGAIRVGENLDGTADGDPVWMQAPNITITAATATNPMTVTLASPPFPATMSVGATITIVNAAGAGCSGLNGNQLITAVSGNTLTLQHDGSGCSYTARSAIALSQDFVFRYHRDLKANRLIGEVWNVDGTGYASKALAILNSSSVALPGTFQIGAAGVNANLAFLRWYSGTIPTGASAPGSASGGDLADWEFEGNGNDKSSNSLNISFAGTPAFTGTPVYHPACLAGSPQSFRVGQAASLDGSGSFALDGGTSLSYSWKQIPSTQTGVAAQNLTWDSSTAMQPTVKGLGFGPLNFQLTVTQGDGQTSTCTVHHGAVTADSNGVVITNTGSASLDSAINTLIGPQMQLGANPWLYYDQAATAEAAVQIADMDLDYLDYWDKAGPGTVTVATGSHVVTGTGTSFTTTFCQGPGNPTVPQNSATIIVWYLTGRTVSGAPETGRRRMWVNSCSSDTELNASLPTDGTGWTSDAPAGAGLSYTADFYNHLWDFGAAPANYYDNVQAYYALYYRSGIDTYLAAARKLADRFWTSPEIDRGMAFNVGDWFGAQTGRSNSVSGLVLRALDTADGHPDMWAGLHNVWTYTGFLLTQGYPNWSNNGGLDAREYGYTLAQAAYGALWDTDPTWQAFGRSIIKSSFQSGAGGVFPKNLDAVQQGWLEWSSRKSTFDSGLAWGGSTVTLTNGSNVATCTSGNCGWQAADFAAYDVNTGSPCSGGSTCGTLPVLFTDSANFPADSSHTDAVSYCYPNACAFMDANHFTLDRPYAGVSGVHGWAFGISGGSISGVVGWGNLPYMEGILGWAFDLAAKAMACSATGGPTNCDNPTSTLAYSYSGQAANWIATYGAVPANYGLSYWAGYPVCGKNPGAENLWCNLGYNNLQSRELTGDAYRGLAAAYRHSPAPALKTILDNWFAGMWAKPGTNPLLPSPDGQYDINFDPTGCTGCGFYLGDGAPYSQKFYGQHFGISNEGGWPAVRLGY